MPGRSMPLTSKLLANIPHSLLSTVPSLQTFFSSPFIHSTIQKLNLGKAIDIEYLQAEFLKHAIHTLPTMLAKLFKDVIFFGFSSSLTSNIIRPMFKIENPDDLSNYRTIKIGHTLAKLYAMALEVYLSRMADSWRFQAIGKDGFHKYYRTFDHIFTLEAIIEEARFQKSPVFCYFVDFTKAFDNVPRYRLME